MVRASILAGLLVVSAGRGQPPADRPEPAITRPRSAERVVRAFDFDERAVNPFPVPRYWRRAQGGAAGPYGRERPGFPLWNQAVLDYPDRDSPAGSVKLPTSGGSTCLRLEAGVVAVFPDADYRVTARVRTSGLSHARARLVARFLDRANAPIEASEVGSELVGATSAWQVVSVNLESDRPDAAFVQLDLELLQPAQFARRELGKHHVWPEDYSGAAWFDDVTIVQLPRIELATGTPSNVVTAPAKPEIRAVVRDLSGEAVRARLTLYDLDGRVVDRVERPVLPGEPDISWVPEAPAFGWYRGVLEVLSASGRVGAGSVDLVWLPPPGGLAGAAADRARLGVSIERLAPGAIPGTLDLLRAARIGAAFLPVWSEELTAESAPEAALRLQPLVEGLRRAGASLTFMLPRVPAALAAATRVAADDPLGVFGAEPSVWARYLVPFLDKYGQSVQSWQLGARADPRPRRLVDAAPGVESARRFLASLVPGPVVTIPWPGEAGLPPGAMALEGAPDRLHMFVDYSTPDDAVGRLAAEWLEHQSDGGLHMTLGVLPSGAYSRRDGVIDLTRRGVMFWAGASGGDGPLPGASIVQPWEWADGRQPRPIPSPLYAAWANLPDRLAGRRFAGEIPLAPGVRCILMAPASGGARGGPAKGLLIAWRESAPPGDAVIRAFLGTGRILAYDPFGNATEVPAEQAGAPTHRVQVSDTPVFVEGVDVALARFVASLRLEPVFFPSGAGPQEAEVILTNPWPDPIAGRLHIVEPGGADGPRPDRSWQIGPRWIEFAAGAGQTVRLPIRIAFSGVEEAGVKPFVVDAELDGFEEYGKVRLRSALEVGLGSLRLDLTYRFGPGPGGPDLIVEAQVGNSGSAPVTLELAAFAPPDSAYPRSRASISDLAPGETVIRRFAYPRGASALRGRRVLVSVQDAGADARINRSIAIE